MTPLLLLAEKAEGLKGPDREVDAEIAAVLRVGTEHEWALRYPAWIAAKDGRVHLEKNGPSFTASAFTASQDAAMSLVPDGCFPHVGKSRGMPANRTWYADCAPPTRSDYAHWYAETEAATPALALVASALRARAAMEAGE